MPQLDFRQPRLFVDAALAAGETVALERSQSNYLGNVLRLSAGDTILVFNGRDGEWQASIEGRKRADHLKIVTQNRPQDRLPNLAYVFAPLKHARFDYMVQKAVELGVSRLQPILTQHTQVKRVNVDRLRANAIEAAEQCGVLSIPEISEPLTFGRALAARKPERLLVFCDEDADVNGPLTALADGRESPTAMLPLTMAGAADAGPQPIALLIGPEGGFAEEERAALLKLPNMVRLSLGPRILRADTAAVAALALIQAVLGDWR